ncbi:hypothetical protein AXF42_Ash018055 [Apostasia shenzhenica]|uniref:Uncharacterized protein n=1 Tax=Apostasia shenzhenica TaxID=1088818 RepID=A0A2I0AVM2_9ASPA|nr:hypothetical protein AXF42_Ash018055 [Apostasia shenzhenica]
MGSLPGHLPELCPVTQSPVRGSPMSSGISSERCCRSQVSISTAGDLSFATAKQSSGIISNDGKKMGLLGKSAEGLTADQKRDLQLVKNLNPAMKTSEIERYNRTDTCEKKASQAVRSARAGGRRRGRQYGNCRVSFKKNASLEVMGKLPTVGEAEDDEDRGSPSRVHRSPIPSCVSPDISHTGTLNLSYILNLQLFDFA